MKKKLPVIFLCLVLTACSADLGSGTRDIQGSISSELKSISDIQENNKNSKGDYERVTAYKKDGVEYDVSHYQTAKGEIGYIVKMIKEEEGKKYIKKEVTGPDAKELSHDWAEYLTFEEDLLLSK